MPTPPRRRWFQFSLGAMFVGLTVVAVWLGWEMKFVRERQAFLRWVETAQREANRPYVAKVSHEVNPNRSAIPFWRRCLGDEPVRIVNLPPSGGPEVLQRASRLFPEATMGYPYYSHIGPADFRREPIGP